MLVMSVNLRIAGPKPSAANLLTEWRVFSQASESSRSRDLLTEWREKAQDRLHSSDAALTVCR